MAITKQTNKQKRKTTSADKVVKKLEPLHIVDENAKCEAVMRNILDFPQNIKNKTTI